jgi:hypothetical protein
MVGLLLLLLQIDANFVGTFLRVSRENPDLDFGRRLRKKKSS